MSEQSGPTSQTPLAFYDRESSCWRTSQGSFDLGLGESSPTWPSSGSMRNGALCERPPLVLAIVESDCSLLPTPAASQAGYNQSESPGAAVRPQLAMLVRDLLPTPTCGDGNGRRTSERAKGLYSSGPTLTDTVTDLLPTPTAKDAPRASDNERGFVALAEAVTDLLPTPTARLGTARGAQAMRYSTPTRSNDLDDAIAWISRGDATDPPSTGTHEPSDGRLPGLSSTGREASAVTSRHG